MVAKKKVATAPAAKPVRAKRAPKQAPALAPANDMPPEVAALPPVQAAAAVTIDPPPQADVAAGEATSGTRKGRNGRYLLPANMEIPSLGSVHADLVALEASNDGPFVLDGANLSVIDTAGLQLLISFVAAVQASGKKVSWENYSVQAYQLANELGVVEQLGD